MPTSNKIPLYIEKNYLNYLNEYNTMNNSFQYIQINPTRPTKASVVSYLGYNASLNLQGNTYKKFSSHPHGNS